MTTSQIIRTIVYGGLALIWFGTIFYWLPALGVVLGFIVGLTLIFELLKPLISSFKLWASGFGWWAEFWRAANRFIVFLVVLAIWGALLWYFAPGEDLATKPLGSLTLKDLAGMLFWVWLFCCGAALLSNLD